MRSYICFYRSIGEKFARNGLDLLVVVLVLMMLVVLVVLLRTFWRGRLAVCGFYDDVCALGVNFGCAVGAPTGKFRRCRKIYQIFDGNLPQLPLNIWDVSRCDRLRFEFKPLVANGIMQRDCGS